ncbi:MAG: dienelactone hydrolase family protein [Planctomycetota bacterium]
MHTERIEYAHGSVALEGYLAYDPSISGPRPGVLVAPTWAGRNDFADGKAEALAALGYVGFALDMYGGGVVGSGPEENEQLMQPLMDDRLLLRERMGAALHTLREYDMVDPHRVGAIGFCFGGLCVLDLARSGAPVRGVVSFHGLLQECPTHPCGEVDARILVLHGYDDPFARPDQLRSFCREMTNAGAEWEVHVYGNTMHAFTNPNANDRATGTVYDERADRRSWRAMETFFEEVLAVPAAV